MIGRITKHTMAADFPTPFADCLNLEHLSRAALFYPCSGNDLETPLRIFGPWVESFRFVDSKYFCASNRLSGPQLKNLPDWKFESRQVEGNPCLRLLSGLGPNIEEEVPHFEPCTVSEVYRQSSTGRKVTMHWHRGDGRKTLDRFTDPIGVFFHRGDDGPCELPGEGSSGSHWLSETWLKPVINRLVNHGFIVTDGSCGNEYPELRRFYRSKIGVEAVSMAQEFATNDGARFKCVGFAGMKYGPTLIWQVTKPAGIDAAC